MLRKRGVTLAREEIPMTERLSGKRSPPGLLPVDPERHVVEPLFVARAGILIVGEIVLADPLSLIARVDIS